jgi:hypothetical protein
VLLKAYAVVDLQDARNILAVRNPDAEERMCLMAQADSLGIGPEVRALLDSPS